MIVFHDRLCAFELEQRGIVLLCGVYRFKSGIGARAFVILEDAPAQFRKLIRVKLIYHLDRLSADLESRLLALQIQFGLIEPLLRVPLVLENLSVIVKIVDLHVLI